MFTYISYLMDILHCRISIPDQPIILYVRREMPTQRWWQNTQVCVSHFKNISDISITYGLEEDANPPWNGQREYTIGLLSWLTSGEWHRFSNQRQIECFFISMLTAYKAGNTNIFGIVLGKSTGDWRISVTRHDVFGNIFAGYGVCLIRRIMLRGGTRYQFVLVK